VLDEWKKFEHVASIYLILSAVNVHKSLIEVRYVDETNKYIYMFMFIGYA